VTIAEDASDVAMSPCRDSALTGALAVPMRTNFPTIVKKHQKTSNYLGRDFARLLSRP